MVTNRRGSERHSRSTGQPLPDRIKNLLRYYIECVRQDEGQSIRVHFNDVGKRFIPWPFSSDLWSLQNVAPRFTLGRDQYGFAEELSRTTVGGGLLYGYPMYVEPGRKAIPLFTWPIEYELHDNELQLHPAPEWPQMHPEYLKRLAPTLEEQQQTLESLGLLNPKHGPPVVTDILGRMDDMGLLPNVLEPLVPQQLSTHRQRIDPNMQGLTNRAALFCAERLRFTAGLIRDLEEMIRSGAPGWKDTAFGTMLGAEKKANAQQQTVIEAVPLNEEQRQAVRKAVNSPLTAVTGPPGTGKSQVVVSLVADSYLSGRRVLFTSKNNKAVDVVENRVASLAENPLMIRTGSQFRNAVTERLATMLASNPSPEDRLRYNELISHHEDLLGQENELWAELQSIRDANSQVGTLDDTQTRLKKDYTSQEWRRLQNTSGRPNSGELKMALQLATKHIDDTEGLLRRFWLWISDSRDRKRIQSIATEARSHCQVISHFPAEGKSFQVWRTWLNRALSVTEALNAIAEYRGGLAALRGMRSRDEVARHLRRVRTELAESGAELVGLYARLAPERLEPTERQAIGNFRSLQERLSGDQLGGDEYRRLRRVMPSLFRDVSHHIPAWCVTNLSARSSLPLEPNLFELLIIDEASQCDIASALPLLYRSKQAVIIGDPSQLRHITNIVRLRDQQLQAEYGLGTDYQRFAYNTNSLFDLASSDPSIGTPILLRDHYRSHPDIVGFSNRKWYQGNLRVWTDYGQLKAPPDMKYGIHWTEVTGKATRPRGGSVVIRSEVEAVVERVVDLLVHQRFDGTVGVVTPFRAQANMIWEEISQRVPQGVYNQAELIVDTAHGFQGDERDIILFSPCVSSDLTSGSHYFLKNTEQLFNVAITRARSLLHVVGSGDACAHSGIPHIEEFAAYCREIEKSGSSPYRTTLPSDDSVGPWERKLYEALSAKGLNPLPQYLVNQYRLDLAIISGETRIDVEADGETTHMDSRLDIERDIRLTELGWRVVRFWNHQIRDDMGYCVRTVLDLLHRES